MSRQSQRNTSGSTFVAPSFPPIHGFHFRAQDVASGAVKVIAKSPSGSTYPLDVIDSNGVYTTNFTPSEIGNT